MAGVMRRHPAFDDRLQVPVMFYFGMFGDKFINDLAALGLARIAVVAFDAERGFRRGFVATPPRGQEDDRGQQIVRAQPRDQLGRRDFGEFKLQCSCL